MHHYDNLLRQIIDVHSALALTLSPEVSWTNRINNNVAEGAGTAGGAARVGDDGKLSIIGHLSRIYYSGTREKGCQQVQISNFDIKPWLL